MGRLRPGRRDTQRSGSARAVTVGVIRPSLRKHRHPLTARRLGGHAVDRRTLLRALLVGGPTVALSGGRWTAAAAAPARTGADPVRCPRGGGPQLYPSAVRF